MAFVPGLGDCRCCPLVPPLLLFRFFQLGYCLLTSWCHGAARKDCYDDDAPAARTAVGRTHAIQCGDGSQNPTAAGTPLGRDTKDVAPLPVSRVLVEAIRVSSVGSRAGRQHAWRTCGGCVSDVGG